MGHGFGSCRAVEIIRPSQLLSAKFCTDPSLKVVRGHEGRGCVVLLETIILVGCSGCSY